MGLQPLEKRDSVYIFFNTEDSNYIKYKVGTVNGISRYIYNIKLSFGKDLCFTNTSDSIESPVYELSFNEMSQLEIKDYQYLNENYADNDPEKLVEKLKWKNTNFFLVVPDSTKQSALILDVFNCNNSSH
ncbi:MAG: hypothetical protein R3321_08785 [Nitrososphaeraceae archaeon]|nr:hypothetical protein [Nitrososphaeraceae archaeon]